MTYSPAQPPFTLHFATMDENELRGYYQWFMRVMPTRIEELARAVGDTPGFEMWLPDCSVSSLGPLGLWFTTQVDTRERTPEEIAAMNPTPQFPVEVPTYELTNRTYSLCLDMGMYFGRVMMEHHPSLRWTQLLKPKNAAYFGQPVIVDFRGGPMNPVWLCITFATRIARGEPDAARLTSLYNIWSADVKS